MRNIQKKWNKAQPSRDTEEKKNHHTLTPMVIAGGKKGAEKDKKQDTNQCSPAVAPNLIPLYIAQCSLSVSLPQYSFSFPLHRIPSLYSSVSPTLPLFHNPDEKKWGSALKIFHGGRRVLAEARQRDEERRRARRDTQRENMIQCSPCKANWKRSLSCTKEAWELLKTKGSCWKLITCGYSKVNASTYTLNFWACTHNTVQYSHSHAALDESVLIKLDYFLKWLMLTLSMINRERLEASARHKSEIRVIRKSKSDKRQDKTRGVQVLRLHWKPLAVVWNHQESLSIRLTDVRMHIGHTQPPSFLSVAEKKHAKKQSHTGKENTFNFKVFRLSFSNAGTVTDRGTSSRCRTGPPLLSHRRGSPVSPCPHTSWSDAASRNRTSCCRDSSGSSCPS